jgi:hypothetical protein
MGFLDIFIERDTTKKVEEPKKTEGNIPVLNFKTQGNSGQPSAQTSSFTPTTSASSEDIEMFNKHFDEIFEKANLPGPDYFEFSKMCQAMNQLTDEVKFPAVFGGLQVQGLTKEKLVESANIYISVIDEDASKFNTAIDQKIVADVQRKRAEAQEKRKAIQEREDMIKKIHEEISKFSSDITNLEAEANDQELKANQKSITYKSACDARKSLILSDIQKISSLIK